jgi:hypothetical protein
MGFQMYVNNKFNCIHKTSTGLNKNMFTKLWFNNQSWTIKNRLCSQKLWIQQKLVANQNSIDVALIPHVRTYKHIMLKLTCTAEINKTGFRLTSSHLCSSASTKIWRKQKYYLRDLLIYAYDYIAVLMMYTCY